jgi:AraC family transcriptional regulator
VPSPAVCPWLFFGVGGLPNHATAAYGSRRHVIASVIIGGSSRDRIHEVTVSTSSIQMVSKGRRVPFFSAPEISSADHPWAGYSFEAADTPSECLPSHSWSKTTLLSPIGGQASLEWKHRGTWHKDRLQSGVVSIMRRDVEIQSAEASNSFPLMVMQLDNLKLQHIAPDHVLTIEKSLGSAQVREDERLATLMSAMFAEVKEECLSGRLYGESISLALLAYLAGTYATPQNAESCERNLSPSQKRSVVAYIRANLSGDICVTDLAGLVSMSPSHFARVFKASLGITPYRFIMLERIEAAKGLLAGTKLPAIQVAMALGFASQSHFVKVFRQFTGVTPKQFKVGL